jgi:putative tricarboxylic transport membrane protein
MAKADPGRRGNLKSMAETFHSLLHGFSIAVTPFNLLWGFIGVMLGTFIGVLPGVGPALTVAMLLPLTVKLDPTGALIMFAGIYYGAMYGGSTTTILLNTPGESASIATALEGNLMAKKGRAGPALAACAIGSFVAGTIATVLVTLLAPLVIELALKFGPAEYFALMVFAFTTVSAVIGSSTVRGLTSLFLGLLLGIIGIDSQTGQSRFAFGVPELLDGIDVVVLAVGLFAVGEALYVAAYSSRLEERIEKLKGSLWMSKEDWKRSLPAWLRATFIGFPFGSIPAGGAEIPTFLSYATEKRLTKYPHEFGNGAIEGVAGPEAANNASVTGALVPLLTLGIPTSATAAVLLSAFQNYGIQPGPLLFQTQSDLVWGLIASLYIGNVLLLILNLPLVGIWVKVLAIPRPLLYGGILLFATLGAYSLHQSVVDLAILYVFGLLGFIMRRWDIPVAPAVIGLILGPLAETQFRRALSISQGDPSVFITQPISATVLAISALLLVIPLLVKKTRLMKP